VKYACKVDLNNSAKESVLIGVKLATYIDVFDIHKAVNRNQILACLPEELKNKKLGIHIVNMNFDRGINELWAHKHLKEKCALNIYFQTNGEETIFYEGKEVELPAKEGEVRSRNGSTKFFKKLSTDTLHKVESFIAKENECWILKTDQPHSVLSHKKTGNRIILQIYFFETAYENVVELFGVEHATC
jgi:hypothetical protein